MHKEFGRVCLAHEKLGGLDVNRLSIAAANLGLIVQ